METREDSYVINVTALYDHRTVEYSVRYSMVTGQPIEFYPATIDYAEEEHRVT